MSIALDVIVIAIFALTLWRCTSKGFIRAVFDMLKCIVAVIVAAIFKGNLAQLLMQSKAYTKVCDAAHGKLCDTFESIQSIKTEEMLDAFRNENPQIVNLIESMGGNLDETRQIVEKAASEGAKDLVSVAARHIIEPVCETIAYVIAFIIIFIAAYIVLWIAEYVLDAMFELPILHDFNTVGGFIVGLLCGAFYVMLIVAVTSPFIKNPEIFDADWDKDIADKTIIYSFVDENNLLSGIKQDNNG